ncbi:hypothetical protein CTEN210_04568 [Chaetoceros tenuissimus]|uniref:CAAX prenyl protease 2/Lysostaphin resistance protein A-like domain-containing protein n=1 Tax=Chaetoceros tenuissimus TaxID=426638 RepID=A0AAD3H2E5_9STRA|nr:hypothetical protein CTEN210_04568 [Chaetoceros tenuissimus]
MKICSSLQLGFLLPGVYAFSPAPSSLGRVKSNQSFLSRSPIEYYGSAPSLRRWSKLQSSTSDNSNGKRKRGIRQFKFVRKNKSDKRFDKVSKGMDNIIEKACNIPPPLQLLCLIGFYIVHLTILTQNSIVFPIQLIPNDDGRFQSLGLDSLAGMISFASIHLLRKRQIRKYRFTPEKITIPPLLKSVHQKYNIQSSQSGKSSLTDSKAPWYIPSLRENIPSAKITSMASLFLLVTGYFMTGKLSQWVELNLYALAGLGLPLTVPMHRSLVVLGGHLAWVLIGSIILGVLLRPQPFFGGGNKFVDVEVGDEGRNIRKKAVSDNASKQEISKKPIHNVNTKKMRQRYKWYSNKWWNDNFLFWAIGGYSISCWFFNIADFINQMVLPAHVFESAGEGVVSQLINPENNDIAASLVGYIAPCISAPWWEEVLYRGFLLPALCLQMNFWLSVFVSGVIFSIHHVSTTGAIPLAILGWTWAGLYAKSGNLFVTIAIHAMWNSRVFLGSWLGL